MNIPAEHSELCGKSTEASHEELNDHGMKLVSISNVEFARITEEIRDNIEKETWISLLVQVIEAITVRRKNEISL